MAVLGQQRVGLERVDVAAQQERHLAVAHERVEALEPAGVALEQERGRTGGLDLLAHAAPVVGPVRPRQPVQLAVEDHAAALASNT